MGKKKYTKFKSETNEQRKFSAMCLKCYNNNYDMKGNIVSYSEMKYKPSYDTKVSGSDKDLNDNAIDTYITRSNLGFDYSIALYCPQCGRRTTHVTIDHDMSDIISTLNKSGLLTKFCCQGHFDKGSFSVPYISFVSDYSKSFFDTNDPLLKYWYIEEYKSDKEDIAYNWGWSLRVKHDIPIIVFRSGEHILNLREYVNKNIEKFKESIMKKKEEEEDNNENN